MSRLLEIFDDKKLVDRVRDRLPYLFQLAELESSRAGKIGMEIGSVRERILVSLLIYKFGRENVETRIPITESEVDVRLFGEPISIKTVTGSGGVKLIWTVDAEKAMYFREAYKPRYDILLAQINWGSKGKLCAMPVIVQSQVFNDMGREAYVKLPKAGTNPRGVEVSREALSRLMSAQGAKSVEILWRREEAIQSDAYEKWIEYWSRDKL